MDTAEALHRLIVLTSIAGGVTMRMLFEAARGLR
jgi:hypothetical protein